MNRRQTLLVGLVLASVAGLVTWWVTSPKGPTEPPSPAQARQQVLVTTRPFGELAPLDPAGVVVQAMPSEDVPPEAVTLLDAVKGRYAARPLEAGTVLRRSDLWEGKVLDLTRGIPAGRRALNIQVSREVNFGQHLQPGQWVDVVGTFPTDRLVIQGVQVLGVYHSLPAAAEEKADRMLVTLAVTPAEATRLLQAEATGQLRLMLRSAAEKEGIRPTPPPAPPSPAPPKGQGSPPKAPPAKAPAAKPISKPAPAVRKAPSAPRAKPKPSYRRSSYRPKVKCYPRRHASRKPKPTASTSRTWQVKVIRGTEVHKVTVGR